MVTARFNNTVNLDFIFDTGAENTVLFDREIPEILGVEYDRRIEVMGSDFNTGLFANIARNTIFKLEGASHVQRDIVVLEENILLLEEKLGINVDGIIGGSFFRNSVVMINYHRRNIRIYHPKKIRKSTFKNYQSFDIVVRQNKPYVKGITTLANGTTAELLFLLDSGASLPFLLHTNTDSLLTLPEEVMSGSLGYGITGLLKGFIGQVNQLKIGEFEFNNLITSFQDINIANSNKRGAVRNGIIGSHLMKRFHIIIDYFNGKLYLKPIRKKKYADEFDYDKSGMIIFAVGTDLNEFLIQEVMTNSPAAKAGFHPGDVITRMGRKRTRFMSLETVNNRLNKKVGKVIKIEIEREGVKMKKELILEDWFKKSKK